MAMQPPPYPSGQPPYPPYPPYSPYGPPPVMRPQGPAPGLVYANFGWRFLAGLIDSVIEGIPSTIIFLIAFASAWPQLQTIFTNQGNGGAGSFGSAIGISVVKVLIIPLLLSVLVDFIYKGLIVGWLSATVGMKVLGLTIVNASDGGRISFLTALARWGVSAGISWGGGIVGAVVPFGFVLPYLDPFWCIWDDRKQTLHDKVVHTFVIKPA